MKKYYFHTLLSAFLAVFCIDSYAQSGDAGKIPLSVYIPQQVEGFPPAAADVLANKLNQVAGQTGTGANLPGGRFIITANVNVLSKDIVAGPPAMHALSLDITLYIGDGIDGRKFASKSIPVKCVGTNETKAYIEGIKMIKANDPSIKAFVDEGKQQIIEYYNANCATIIKEAQKAASLNNYDESIYLLSSVPVVCQPCYDKTTRLLGPMYKNYIERQCKVKLVEARANWSATQNAEGAADAASVLSTIDPSAPCYREALSLSQEIGKRIKEVDKREWDFKMKVVTGQIQTNKDLIQTYRDIAIGYAKNQPRIASYKISDWW